MAYTRRWVPVFTALLLASAVLPLAPAGAQPATSDGTIAIINQDEAPSPSEITVRLSRVTPLPDTSRVIISRDDQFADALASGLLQGSSPLLLVPREGPIPAVVLEEIQRLGATSVVILGGTAAVSTGVEDQLRAQNLSTSRRRGANRIETAIDIARQEAPAATTIMLARAGSTDPVNNPTQGFADALSAGAVSAENGWPILLTDTDGLTPATRDYLATSPVEDIKIIGGTAAVSSAVETELRTMVSSVERISGPSRFDTAAELAKETGATSAADVDQVVLVDGTSPEGFVGGFASAAHAALNDAPVLLADGIRLPPQTEAFLQPGASFAQAGSPLAITCVVHPLACDGGREELGLVDFPLLEVAPSINSAVQPGQQVQLTLSPIEEGRNTPVTIKGSCLSGQQDLVTDGSGVATFTLTQSPVSTFCSVEVSYGVGGDAIQQGYSYTFDPSLGRGSGIGVASDVFSYGTEVPTTPIYLADEISCTGPAGTEARPDSAYRAQYLHPDGFVNSYSLTSFSVEAQPGDACTATAQVPDGIGRVLWGLYSWSDSGLRNPLLVGDGPTAAFDFDDLGTAVSDVNIVWILETHQTQVGAPPQPAGGTVGQVFNPDGLTITCGSSVAPAGLSVQTPGTLCSVAAPPSGLGVLVVAPNRPLTVETGPTFTVPGVAQAVGIYTIITDDRGTTTSCEAAPGLPFAQITPGMTTPTAPVARYSVNGVAGATLRLRVDSVGQDSTARIDPTIRVIGPDGQQEGFNDDGDSGLNSRLDLTLAATGPYCIEVEGYGGSTGEFLLTFDPSPSLVESGSFSAATPFVDYTVDGVAGDLLVLELRAAGFEPTDPLFQLYAPDGSLLITDDDGGGYPNSRLAGTLPVTGTYTIRATTYQDRYGAFTLEGSYVSLGGGSSQAFASAAEALGSIG